MKKILALILALSFAAFAGDDDDEVPPPDLKGDHYLTSCPDLLIPGHVEEFFLKGVKTKEQMFQLLFDYRIILSGNYHDAFLIELEKQKLPIKDIKKLADLQVDTKEYLAYRVFAQKLKEISELPDDGLRPMVWAMAENIVALRSSQGKDENVQRIRHLQAKHLIDALKTSPQREMFEKIMIDLMRQTLWASVRHSLDKIARTTEHEIYDRAKTIGHSIQWGSAVIGNLLWFGYTFIFGDGVPHVGYVLVPNAALAAVVTPIAYTVNRVVKGRDWKEVNDLDKKLQTPEVLIYEFHDSQEGQLRRSATHLWKSLSNELGSGVLAVGKVCKKNICTFSPVEIAYLGHLDIMELEVLATSMREALKPEAIEKQLTILKDAAVKLNENPDQYRAQMEFKFKVEESLAEFKRLSKLREKVAEDLIGKATKLQEQMRELKKKPYTDEIRGDDRYLHLSKNELFLNRLDTDLKTLDKIKLDNEALRAKVAHIQDIVTRVQAILTTLPTTLQGWRDAAVEITIALDLVSARPLPY